MSTYLTLAECKTHLRVDFTDDDTYIQHLADLVEELVKTEISGTFVGEGTVSTVATTALTGVETNFSDYSVGDSIYVDGETVRPIATIVSDTSLTVTGEFTTTASNKTYYVITGLPLVGGVLPLGLRHAMLLMVGHYYALREPVMVGVGVTEIPLGFKFLIHAYKNFTVA